MSRDRSVVRKLVISGYYGFDNSGDEAVLVSILHALREADPTIEPIVLSANPDATSKAYGVRAVHRMKPLQILGALRGSSGLISGGGSLLQDVTGSGSVPYYLGIMRMARLLRKPVYIYSQGIGPVRRPLFQNWIRSTFNACAYVSVRDPESAALIQGWGVKRPVEVVPDPVMGMPSATQGNHEQTSNNDGYRVGISVRFWNADRSELQALADGLNRLAERLPVTYVFLPFHLPSDLEASKYVAERLNAKAEWVEDSRDPREMAGHVEACDLLIGMRLHSLIYAASREVPMAGVSYDPKIDQFLQQLGMKAVGTTDRLDPASLADTAASLLEGAEAWRAETCRIIEQLRKKSQTPAQHIAASLRK